MSKLMRISDLTINKLESLSKLTGQTKQKILDRAVTLYAYEQILKKANIQYATLKKNTKAWKDIQKEHALWDITLNDGLKND
jgi:hypothetical protein